MKPTRTSMPMIWSLSMSPVARVGLERCAAWLGLAWVEPEPWSLLWLNSPVQAFLSENFDQELRVAFCAAFLKPAEIGTRTPYHQDQALWSRQLPGAVSCWVALDRADEENGCLIFCPGSQHGGEVAHEEPPGGGHPEVVSRVLDSSPKEPVPLDPGSGVIWDRYTVHGSAENHSKRPRRAVVTVFAPSSLLPEEDPLVWSPDRDS